MKESAQISPPRRIIPAPFVLRRQSYVSDVDTIDVGDLLNRVTSNGSSDGGGGGGGGGVITEHNSSCYTNLRTPGNSLLILTGVVTTIANLLDKSLLCKYYWKWPRKKRVETIIQKVVEYETKTIKVPVRVISSPVPPMPPAVLDPDILQVISDNDLVIGYYELTDKDKWEAESIWHCSSNGNFIHSFRGRWAISSKLHHRDGTNTFLISEAKHQSVADPTAVQTWLRNNGDKWVPESSVRISEVSEKQPESHFDRDIRKCFTNVDSDRDGIVSFSECLGGLQALGHPFKESELSAAFSAVDISGNHRLNLSSFTKLVFLMFPSVSRTGQVFQGLDARRM